MSRTRQLRFWWLWSRRAWRRQPEILRFVTWLGWIGMTFFAPILWLLADTTSFLELATVWAMLVVAWPVVIWTNYLWAKHRGW